VCGKGKNVTKHKTFLMTLCSAGLRLSEATGLVIFDSDSDRMQIRVNQHKGKKDRYTLLSNILLHQLRHYRMTFQNYYK
jgi:integrase